MAPLLADEAIYFARLKSGEGTHPLPNSSETGAGPNSDKAANSGWYAHAIRGGC